MEIYNPAFWQGQSSASVLDDWMGKTRICPACGKEHSIMTQRIEEVRLGTGEIGRFLDDLGFKGRCVVVMDQNTRQAAGMALMDDLARFSPAAEIFDRPELHADEHALGTLLADLADMPDFLVSCGSGTITDITRYVSLMTSIPFVSFATTASVDGFASSSTPLIVRGFKKTFAGVPPKAIFYDPTVLARAPAAMTAAGFGDVAAKIIALMDWRLAAAIDQEEFCPLVASLVDQAVQGSFQAAHDFLERRSTRENVCVKLMASLSLSGIGMQMMSNSRPASGAEHHISHLLEMRDIQRHRTGSLHGDKVGIGTLISMVVYQRLFAGGRLPAQRPFMPAVLWEKEVRRVYGTLADQAIAINSPQPPQGAEWERQIGVIEHVMSSFGYQTVASFQALLPQTRDLILSLGGPVRPDQLGYSVSDTYDAIAFGKEVRPKLTSARIAERFGWLYDLAADISEELPKGTVY